MCMAAFSTWTDKGEKSLHRGLGEKQSWKRQREREDKMVSNTLHPP